jgi:D-3-phosphoglycerate dehydrogenase
MQIATRTDDNSALVYVNLEGNVDDAVIEEIREAIDLKNIWRISL